VVFWRIRCGVLEDSISYLGGFEHSAAAGPEPIRTRRPGLRAGVRSVAADDRLAPCAESFRWPRASPRYNRDRVMRTLTLAGGNDRGDEAHDGVPLYGSRQRKEVYDWHLTRHRYLLPQPPPSSAAPSY